MDALGSFLKTALYRVIFVLIVGIPAVEVFSFALFNNGIMIKKNPTLSSKVVILAKPDKKHPGITEIPTIDTTSFKNGIVLNKIAIISNAETRIDEDPRLLILPPNTFKINGNLFSIQPITSSALILYLIVAFILGEILCFIGELFIGLIFNWNITRHEEQIFPGSINKIFYIKSFSSGSSESEFSEIFYVLSKIFSGIAILDLAIITLILENKEGMRILLLYVSTISLLFTLFPLISSKLAKPSRYLGLSMTIITFIICSITIHYPKNSILFYLIFILIISFLISIYYRAEANKIAKYSQRN